MIGGCESEMLKFNVTEEMHTLYDTHGVGPVSIQKIDCNQVPNNQLVNNSQESIDGKYVLVTLLKK